MWLTNLLVYKQKQSVERQSMKIRFLQSATELQQEKAAHDLSYLIARPDTLAIIFASGCLNERLLRPSGSNKVHTIAFLSRLLKLVP
jgi:hypothetical protein